MQGLKNESDNDSGSSFDARGSSFDAAAGSNAVSFDAAGQQRVVEDGEYGEPGEHYYQGTGATLTAAAEGSNVIPGVGLVRSEESEFDDEISCDIF